MRTFLFFCLLLASQVLSANALDSLIAVYVTNKGSLVELQYGDILDQLLQTDSSFQLIDNSIKLATEQEDKERIARLHSLLGGLYLRKTETLKADSIYKLALNNTQDEKLKAALNIRFYETSHRRGQPGEIYLKNFHEIIAPDTLDPLMSLYYYSYARFHIHNQDWYPALGFLIKMKELVNEEVHATYLLSANYTLGIIYEGINASKQSLKIFEENRRIAQKINSPRRELFALFGISNSHLRLNQTEEAIKACEEAFALKERTGVSIAFGFIYAVLSDIHIKKGEFDKAIEYANLGIAISKEQNEDKELSDNYKALCEIYLLKEDFQKAIEFGEKAQALMPSVDSELYYYLGKAYENVGQLYLSNHFLKEGLREWEYTKADSSEYMIISQLIEEKFERELTTFQNELDRQRMWTISSFLGLGVISLLIWGLSTRKAYSKLKELNQTLKKRNKALNQFAYIASHDLKEPVRNIKSFSGLLKRKFVQQPHKEDEIEYLEFIQNSSQTLYEIVNSLKTFTDVSFGKVNREPVLIEPIFKQVQEGLAQFLKEHDGEVYFTNPENLQTIQFSQTMLLLILQNLIQNGIKYNESDIPRVEVSVKSQGKKTLFEVKDNGIGIKPDYFEKIFLPFKTLKNKSITKSSGLGLAICKNILESYEGKIWVESDGINGSSFFVFI